MPAVSDTPTGWFDARVVSCERVASPDGWVRLKIGLALSENPTEKVTVFFRLFDLESRLLKISQEDRASGAKVWRVFKIACSCLGIVPVLDSFASRVLTRECAVLLKEYNHSPRVSEWGKKGQRASARFARQGTRRRGSW